MLQEKPGQEGTRASFLLRVPSRLVPRGATGGGGGEPRRQL